MTRFQAIAHITRHRDDDASPVAVLVVVLAVALVLAPMAVGAAICAGWWS